MIEERAWEDRLDEPRPAFCWQTWLLWAVVVVVYATWTYLQVSSVTDAAIDWTRFALHTLVAALIALVVKEWLDLRIARVRGK